MTLFAIYKAYFVILLHIHACYNKTIASKKERVTGMMIVRYQYVDGPDRILPVFSCGLSRVFPGNTS